MPHATLLTVDPVAPDPAVMAQMGAVLRLGDVVAFPTETVYGLGAAATQAEAVARIFAAKGRPSNDPLIVHIASVAQLPLVTGFALAELPRAAQILAARFWPGPLTLILPRGPLIPPLVAAGLATVGVRLPAHPVAQALITAAGVPIAAPSANRFGHTSPTTAQHVFADLGERIRWIVDGGPCPVGVESTIVDVTRTPPRLLRPGGVSREDLTAALGQPILFREHAAAPTTTASAAPGLLLSHYAPRARLIIFEGTDIAVTWERALAEAQSLASQGIRVGALAPDALAQRFTAVGAVVVAIGPAHDPTAIAQRLFAGLHTLDAAAVTSIVCGSFASAGLGLAIRDRLWRAAGGVVRSVG
jgi:L-threonylcarbamoyladenylate synthase